MQIQKIIFINRAPFGHLELNFKRNGINVLTAINGRGKTTIISHIVDAIYELSRSTNPTSYEGKENKFYRVSSPLFCLDKSKYSLVHIRFLDEDEIIDYLDCRGKISESDFNSITSDITIQYHDVKNILDNANCAKVYSQNCVKKKVEHIFETSIATYFPAYRYEQPVYLNDPYKQTYHLKQEVLWGGALPNPIEVITSLNNLSDWILDIVLDGEVYTCIQSYRMPDGSIKQFDTTPEKLLLGNINNVLSNILSSKNYGKLRFAITSVTIADNELRL